MGKKKKNGFFILSQSQRNKLGFMLMVFIFSVCSVLVFFPQSVQADAWWGEGYRPPDWVKNNGGTIVYYAIKGKKQSDKYKARMYQGSQRIEIEYGSSGVFDDAIAGTYSISAYEGGDKIGSVSFAACPGGTLHANFDADKETASISACRQRVVKKTAATNKEQVQDKNEQEDSANLNEQEKTDKQNQNLNDEQEDSVNLNEQEKTDEQSQDLNVEDISKTTEEGKNNQSEGEEEKTYSGWKGLFSDLFNKLFSFNFLRGK